MAYSKLKSASKALPPIILTMVVKAAVEALKTQGITVDDTIAIGAAMAGYATVVNWLKNRNKK